MKKLKKIIQIVLLIIGCLAVATYIVYAMYIQPEQKEDTICQGVVFSIAEDPYARFVNESDIRELLSDKHINPQGKKMKDVDLSQIEQTIRRCQYIDSVECFKTSQDKVCVYIVQRTPVMYIMPDSMSSSYFIDSRGRVINSTHYSTNMIVATGSITKQYAIKHLVVLGNFLCQNHFWNDQIEQIHVSKEHNGEIVIDCVPRVGNQIIHLGTIDDFETKFNRLKQFYEKAMPLIGWNHYSRFNLKYANQIICTKAKNYPLEQPATVPIKMPQLSTTN